MFSILRTNYVRHTATIYIVQLSGILLFFSILFYVIQSKSDRVTVFSFRIANMTCCNDVSDDTHHGLVIYFGWTKDFYIDPPILVQITWSFLQYVPLFVGLFWNDNIYRQIQINSLKTKMFNLAMSSWDVSHCWW